MKHEKFVVTGMTCSACSAHVEKSVSKVEGVSAVSVNLLAGSMAVDFDEKATGPAALRGDGACGGGGPVFWEVWLHSFSSGQRRRCWLWRARCSFWPFWRGQRLRF